MAKNEKQKAAAPAGEPEVEKKEGKEEAVGQAQEPRAQAPKYDVRVGLFPSEGPVRGVCTVTINGEFAVKNVKIIEGSKGLFVSMPSYKSGEEYKDLFFPVTKEARAELQEAVLNEYERQVQIHRYDGHQGSQQAQAEAPQGVPMNAMA
jgi:stage V sporulation protein G